MPKTAAKFGQELQLALQPMILKPSSAGGIMVGVHVELKGKGSYSTYAGFTRDCSMYVRCGTEPHT